MDPTKSLGFYPGHSLWKTLLTLCYNILAFKSPHVVCAYIVVIYVRIQICERNQKRV